eukprot:COSAG05_NODE_2322_length_3236_cov_2.431304_4_plen_151_part_00
MQQHFELSRTYRRHDATVSERERENAHQTVDLCRYHKHELQDKLSESAETGRPDLEEARNQNRWKDDLDKAVRDLEVTANLSRQLAFHANSFSRAKPFYRHAAYLNVMPLIFITQTRFHAQAFLASWRLRPRVTCRPSSAGWPRRPGMRS